jgi:hypothetical protein
MARGSGGRRRHVDVLPATVAKNAGLSLPGECPAFPSVRGNRPSRPHIEGADALGLLDSEAWRELCPLSDWEEVLPGASETAEPIEALRQATRTGRPCAGDSVVAEWERPLGRKLRASYAFITGPRL